MRRQRKPTRLRAPALAEDQILAWADAHHRLTGRWPTVRGRPQAIRGAPAERWSAIDGALRVGLRGLPGGSSLATLLADRRGARNPMALPPLSVGTILRWCDAFHRSTGEWPRVNLPARRQAIAGSDGETWRGVHAALCRGNRGLSGGSSLAKVLAGHRGVRNVGDLPLLTVRQVLKWADAHHLQTGRWPAEGAKPQEIPGSGGETWCNLIKAMRKGHRGLPRGSSLADLLAEHWGVRPGRRRRPRPSTTTWSAAWP